MSEREVRVEASVPAQTRVDMRSLAEMDKFWQDQGFTMKSMSQLISWTVDLCRDFMKKNDIMKTEFKSVREAHEYLEERGLYQKSMKKRIMDKVNVAARFENMRFEGVDPATYDRAHYKSVHNDHSVNPATEEAIRRATAKAIDVEKKMREEEYMKDRLEQQKRLHENYVADKNGVLRAREVPLDREESEDSDIPRKATAEELDAKAIALEKKDREQLLALKNMPAASEIFKQNV